MGSINTPPEPAWNCLQDVLRDRTELRPSQHLIFYPLGNTSTPKEIPYSTLYAQAKKNSVLIRSLEGFEEGRPVLLHLNDHWDTILWFWAVLLANGLPVLDSPFSNVDHHRHKHIKGLSDLLESPICITRAESLHLFDGSHTMRLHAVESLLATQGLEHGDGSYPSRRRYISGIHQSAAPALLMLTSGSTGSAKAVRLTHKQVLAAVAGKASVRPLPSNRPFLNWIGLDHVASLVEIHLQALWLGVDQVHVHAADVVSSPRTFLDLLSGHRVSRSFAPNFFLARLVSISTPNEETWDLSSLVVLASGGEANDVNTCVAASTLLEKYGAPRNVITPGFGMTETCAGAIFNLECPDYDVANGRSVASLGKCMRGMEMCVTVTVTIGEGITSTRLASPNEPGDLEVRGEVVFDGYYRNPIANAQALTSEGWFRTGDQATVDSAGNLCLIGRVKDVININGVKMIAADVQTSIERALGHRVARLITFPSRASHTEQVTVAYVPREWPIRVEDVAEVDDLTVQACILSTASRPFIFSLQEQSLPLLPTSALGKISRAKMRYLFEAGVFDEDVNLHRQALGVVKNFRRDKMRPRPTNEAEESLISDFAETLGITSDTIDINIDTSVFDLGFTSMDLIRLKHRIDTRLGTTIPVIMLLKHTTARSLAVALNPDPELSEQPTPVVADYDPVVTFRSSGTKTPLWLVHPGVGEVLVFVGLAQHLADDDRPVYALRARGFEPGQPGFSSINEVVDTYAAAIRRRQPRGPYALAGYSYGTMLAFQIAKKLDMVCFLGSFNLPPHIKSRMRQLNWNMCLLHLTYFLGLTTEAYADGVVVGEKGFRAMSRKESLAQILSVVDSGRMEELGQSEQALARWADVAYGLQSMAVDYEPEGMVDAIDVFHAVPLKVAAASREEWVRDHLSRWSDFCRTEPRFHEVGGAHYTMIGPDHVLGFSAKLKAALEARGV
ncbi:hypothetical protein G7Y89_g4830 [Cudoniella acicularis]|uniref:Carrier domain-containing protein n=1 Tax=Cudoniella acicularis TaxID=354080 RepID=A0A8H4RQV2_9HELO|nr:hypothetical protein G7Y89_g4830 [Cudoniella acicularis]